MISNRTLILGGGLSGLSTAYFLKKKGIPFILLEKKKRLGGVMESFKAEDRVYDKAAVSFSLTPEISEIINDLDLNDEVVHAKETSAARYIFRRGKLRKLTASPISIFTSPLLSLKGKLRLLRESRVKSKSPHGESVKDFVSRRFGEELYESVANAVLSGIYAGDPDKMEAAVVLKQFVKYEAEYGSVIKGLKANKGKNKRVITSFKNGSGVLIDSLKEAVSSSCISSAEVESIEREGKGFRVKTVSGDIYVADKVISCLPAYAASKMFRELFTDISESLSQIPYCEMQMSHLAYKSVDVKNSIDGFGFLIPRIEEKPLLGAVINSNVFENRASKEEMTFTLFSKPDLGYSTEQARNELENILEIKANPSYSEVTTWKKAIPQFEIGHSGIIKTLEEFEVKESIVLSGSYRSGVAVGDCVRFAKEVAQRF